MKTDGENGLSDVILNKKNMKNNHSINIVGLAHFLLTLVLWIIQFYGVRYIRLDKKYLITRRYQSNILTFNSNFFFFSLFEIFEILKSFALFIKSHYLSSHATVNFHVYYQLFRVFVFGFILRPIIILILLKRNMPQFFTEENQELLNENKRFYILGSASPALRQQLFSSVRMQDGAGRAEEWYKSVEPVLTVESMKKSPVLTVE